MCHTTCVPVWLCHDADQMVVVRQSHLSSPTVVAQVSPSAEGVNGAVTVKAKLKQGHEGLAPWGSIRSFFRAKHFAVIASVYASAAFGSMAVESVSAQFLQLKLAYQTKDIVSNLQPHP